MDHGEDKHEMDDVPDADDVVKEGAEAKTQILVEVSENVGRCGVAEEEIARDGCEGVNNYAEEGGDAGDFDHVRRGAVAELGVDGLHVEVADVGVRHDGKDDEEVKDGGGIGEEAGMGEVSHGKFGHSNGGGEEDEKDSEEDGDSGGEAERINSFEEAERRQRHN